MFKDLSSSCVVNNGTSDGRKVTQKCSENNSECASFDSNGSEPCAADHEDFIRINGSTALDTSNDCRVLVLYTGGTIGMVKNLEGGLAPLPNQLASRLRESALLHDQKYASLRSENDSKSLLVLPDTGEGRRILYEIKEYNPLMDSSNMGVEDWIHIACDIKENYEHFDGFVILHGTDTMAYTSSALSFMLENLGKTVVVTGSQIPLWELRSDGRDNLIMSLVIAGYYVIPEVTVVFGAKVMRGNRVVKASSDALSAFSSPNMSPLATIGIDISVDYHSVLRPLSSLPFSVHTKMCYDVGLLRIFPSISAESIRSFLRPLRGAVLQTYGSGNIPSKRTDLLEVLAEASSRKILLVNCTQCTQGRVADLYETGKVLENLGVVCGGDMTVEAALAKLSYILTKDDLDFEAKKDAMRSPIRGELTPVKQSCLCDNSSNWKTLDIAMKAMQMASENLADILIPSLMCAAAVGSGIAMLTRLLETGVDPSIRTTEHRTALHVAALEGNLPAVKLLLQHGAKLHVKDKLGRTPLMDAIQMDRHSVIRELRRFGAHLSMEPLSLGEKLCSVAGVGDIRRLESFLLAGADLSQGDASGRTPLHVAALLGNSHTVRYLRSAGVDASKKDSEGRTAADLAKQHHVILQDILTK